MGQVTRGHDRTPPWRSLDAERVRATEDRLRVERLGTRLADRSPASRVLGGFARRAGHLARPSSQPATWPAPHPDGDGLRVIVSIAAPSDRMATRWGDWHLAAALARSLDRAGHLTVVETSERRIPTPNADIRLVFRGIERIERTGDRPHVLWIISHPERVTTAECDEADLVLVASPRFAAALRARTSTPVEVLLQATDHYRFRPLHRRDGHVEARHDVLVVAKTRDVPRPIVLDAITAGLRPAIYGTGWECFVEPSLVTAHHVPNNELPVLYGSAGVVLNDHWTSMRDNGFVSNRILDVLACEVPVVSDQLPEIVELFGDAVPTYATPDELGVIVEACLRDPEQARRRAARGREIVLAEHTFDHRASELLAHLRRHGLVRPD